MTGHSTHRKGLVYIKKKKDERFGIPGVLENYSRLGPSIRKQNFVASLQFFPCYCSWNVIAMITKLIN